MKTQKTKTKRLAIKLNVLVFEVEFTVEWA